MHVCMFSHVWLLVAPWTAAHCSPPGSSVHGIFQARVLEWVVISFSRGSSQPRDWTQVSRTAGRRFTVWATREAHNSHYYRVNACCLSILYIGEGNGTPLQYSCLENPRDRGACWAAVYGVAQSRTWLKWLSSNLSLSPPFWTLVTTSSCLWVCFCPVYIFSCIIFSIPHISNT